jgi:hypothetical protein
MQVNVVPLTPGAPPSIVVGGKSGLFIYEPGGHAETRRERRK